MTAIDWWQMNHWLMGAFGAFYNTAGLRVIRDDLHQSLRSTQFPYNTHTGLLLNYLKDQQLQMKGQFLTRRKIRRQAGLGRTGPWKAFLDIYIYTVPRQIKSEMHVFFKERNKEKKGENSDFGSTLKNKESIVLFSFTWINSMKCLVKLLFCQRLKIPPSQETEAPA